MTYQEQIAYNMELYRDMGRNEQADQLRDATANLIRMAVEEERERCAKKADDAADRVFDEEAIGACRHIATAIRKEPA